MKENAGCIFYVIYLLMGLVQIFAIVKGVQIWFGLEVILSFIVAILITYIPIVGTVAGIIGASKGWGWSYTWAILFFGWPYLIYLILILSVGVSDLFRRK